MDAHHQPAFSFLPASPLPLPSCPHLLGVVDLCLEALQQAIHDHSGGGAKFRVLAKAIQVDNNVGILVVLLPAKRTMRFMSK